MVTGMGDDRSMAVGRWPLVRRLRDGGTKVERGGLEAAATIYNGCCRSGALQGSTVPMVGMGSARNGLPRSLRSLAMTREGDGGKSGARRFILGKKRRVSLRLCTAFPSCAAWRSRRGTGSWSAFRPGARCREVWRTRCRSRPRIPMPRGACPR